MDPKTPGNTFTDISANAVEENGQVPSDGQKNKNPSEKRKGYLWTLLSLIGLFFLKLKKILLLFKFAKFGITAISMITTVWIYAVFYGWAFAAGVVILIFLHEMGHAFAIRMKGIRAGAPVFIPFVGAVLAMKDHPKDVKVESFIAYGGPLAGAIVSSICYSLFKEFGNSLFLVLAYIGFMMNLFNLIPISPLDGGRIVAAVSTKIWGAGLLAILLFFLKTHNPILLMILVLGGIRFWKSWKHSENDNTAYYQVEPSFRWNMGLSYLGIVLYLGYMTVLTLNRLNQDGIKSSLGL